MEYFWDWIADANRKVTLIIALIGFATAAIVFFRRKGRGFIDEATDGLRRGQTAHAERITAVEKRIGKMDDHTQSLDHRLRHIEAKLPLLATREDVDALKIQIAAIHATGRKTEQMVDTIYRAAIEGSKS